MNIGKVTAVLVSALLVGLAVSYPAISFNNASVKPGKNTELDTQFLPISPDTLRSRLRTAKTEVDFVELCNRARRHNLIDIAQSTLKQLTQSHPKSILYLGAYWYSITYGGRPEFTKDDTSTRQAIIDLHGLETNYWLPLVIEGEYESSDHSNADGIANRIALARKAVRIAPNISITHLSLEEAYTTKAYSTWNGHSFGPSYNNDIKMAAHEIDIAENLEPANCYVYNRKIWFDLFYKSMDKARLDKQHFLAMVSDQTLLYGPEKMILSAVK